MDEALVTQERGNSTWARLAEELRKLGLVATPMVVVTVSQNLLRLASMAMIGHLGELELAGAAVATSLTNVTGFSLLFGLAAALETLCGQAFGAGQYQKVGVYTCSAMFSLLLACLPIALLWIFMDKLLVLIGQDPLISAEACKFSVWLIPSLFPYAILQLIVRYLQSQSLILPMLWSSVGALIFHVPVCWALVFGFDLGVAGAALAIGFSYTVNAIMLGVYVGCSSACEKTRISFSKDIFRCSREFVRFGIPSAVMICLEWWSYAFVILLAGLLPKPQLETSVLSMCLTISAVHYYIPYSLGAAASTRVSNELGAGNPGTARTVVWGVTVLGAAEVVIACTTLFCCRSILGYAFGEEEDEVEYIKEMVPFLCINWIWDSAQAILSGVARGTGWQHIGAYVNLGAYYLGGIPAALVLGFVFHLKGKGLWAGLTIGAMLQSVLLALVTSFTDWQTQATKARERIYRGRVPGEKQQLC